MILVARRIRVRLRSIVFEQLPRLDLEPPRDPGDVIDRDVTFGALDGAEVGPIDTALVRERLLAQAARGSQPAHVLRQYVSQWSLVRPLHGRE